MTQTGRTDRWTHDVYLKKRCEFVNEVAGCIRRLEIDSRCIVDSYRLAGALFDYAFFYATQVNDITVINPDIDAQREFNQRDWLASFTLIFMKVKRLVEGYQPTVKDKMPGKLFGHVLPEVYSGAISGEQLLGELKGLQDDMNVLLNGGDEKGTDHE